MLKTFLKKNVLKKQSLIISKRFYSQENPLKNNPEKSLSENLPNQQFDQQPLHLDTSKSQFLNSISTENKEKIENLLEPIYETEASKSIFSQIWDVISPVQNFEAILTSFHSLGLPWWGAIATTAVIFKILLVPVVINTMKNAARMQNIQQEVSLLHQRIKESMRNPKEQLHYRNEMKNLYKKHKTSPFKSLLGTVFQIPIFISYFMTIRGMSASVESFADGGLWWFTNLTIADPFYILPLISTGMTFANMELNRMMGGASAQIPGKLQVYMKWGLRGIMVLTFPFVAQFQASFLVYWVTTNTFTLIQTFILNQPAVKKALGIPLNQTANITTSTQGPFSKLMNIGVKPKKQKIYDQAELHQLKREKKLK